MPFHLHFGPEDLLRCRFAVSPLWETQEAIRTLRQPHRHAYYRPWLRQVAGVAAEIDLAPIRLLMPRTGYAPDFLCPPPRGPFTPFDEELAHVRATDPELVRKELARSLADTPGAAESERGRAMLADPAGALRELTALLERAWRLLLLPRWPRQRALLEDDVAFRTRQLASGGLERLFADLHPKLTWADGTLTIGHRADHRRVLRGEGLMLVPSAFVWPKLIGGFDPPWQATLVYPARGIGTLWSPPDAPPPDTLVRLLGPNRAALLSGLDAPASTTALAERHGLALSSVSAHLSVLRDAGLLTARRRGRQVLYERTGLGAAVLEG
ncbi:DUF5937 family protein [Streptomyces sp. I05A-00742]|uniref:ArsR/SmtB family transcription factor n=1 Tax=Streptomyces sp. I05A-00742 TaxID=2732853 RepID=UPI001487C7DD|nr:DUF5937 family protein [Streptomyces sp. I05A-00742]